MSRTRGRSDVPYEQRPTRAPEPEEPAISDGPYIEAKEYLGSFTIIDCESLDRALEIAAKNPFTKHGAVELAH